MHAERRDQSGAQAFKGDPSLLGGQFSKNQYMQMSQILNGTHHHGFNAPSNDHRCENILMLVSFFQTIHSYVFSFIRKLLHQLINQSCNHVGVSRLNFWAKKCAAHSIPCLQQFVGDDIKTSV